ncbi:uncharacterized protein LOC113377049 isoform X2 [Ctenocephalides felis]|uniref:uncharacterized protein LOC113377049 isoform X2 n=1 Tax=Ctenocephalides felis TaxID=7515 RepID=UPI000E6E3FAE|nr:uncharacterized protein LOC113377049 isoform X2 [Ctenocephalides felis]
MKHSASAPPEEVKLNPFEILSEIDAREILHIITDGKCKIPTTSNFTKVQLPRGNQKPIDINVCNKISIEPSKKVKILIYINALLWLLTTLLFSISLGYIYIELQAQKQNVYELSQTLLTISSKYEFLSDSVTQSLIASDFISPESIHDNQTKDNTAHSDNIYGKTNTDKYSSDRNTSGNKKKIDNKYDDFERDKANATNHSDGSIAYRKNQQNSPMLGGPAVIQFTGAVPRVDIANEGLIGPWVTDDVGSGIYNLTEFYITEQGNAIEIVQSGLYIIYSQVYYENF